MMCALWPGGRVGTVAVEAMSAGDILYTVLKGGKGVLYLVDGPPKSW